MKKPIYISIVIIAVALLVFFLYLKPSRNVTDRELSSADTTNPLKVITPDSLQSLSDIKGKEQEDKEGNKDTISASTKNNSSTIDSQAKKQDPAANSTASYHPAKEKQKLWPVKTPPLLSGSLLPSHRIIAFYGNLYSTRMGILGEHHPDTMLNRLKRRVAEWQKADSSKKAIPALQLITMTGQGRLNPGRDSLYRLRMPFWMVDSVINMARSINGIAILDFQVGKSTVEKEIPYYEKYLKMPDVHLAVDPEFYMQRGNVPGTHIGTMDAKDINFCINYLKKLVIENHLPPKTLTIHRFTQKMVTNYQDIKLQSQVQVILDMDGFGAQALKKDAYRRFIYREPIEYTGIKLFLKNDNANGHKILSPKDVLQLHPQPVYIQYQ